MVSIPDRYIKPSDSQQYIFMSSCHPFYCRKCIPYSQVLTLNRISSNNELFDKRCMTYRKKALRKWIQWENGTQRNTASESYAQRCTFREN